MFGAPGEIRTPDQVVRSHLLYPAELRVHNFDVCFHTVICSATPLQPGEMDSQSAVADRSPLRGALWASKTLRVLSNSRPSGSKPPTQAIQQRPALYTGPRGHCQAQFCLGNAFARPLTAPGQSARWLGPARPACWCRRAGAGRCRIR